jgi:hypothetical protein
MIQRQSPQHKPYRLRALWYDRQQTAQECAFFITAFLKQIESFGSPFMNWTFVNSKNKSEAIPCDIDDFRKRVLEPIGGRRGAKPEETDSLGFSYMLFGEGKTSESVILLGHCGGSNSHSFTQLDFPQKGAWTSQLLQVTTLRQLMEVTVKYWNPEWAVIDYFDDEDPDSHSPSLVPVYWFTYLQESRGEIPILPEQCSVNYIDGYGSYIIITPEEFDREREDHRAISNQVKVILDEAGLRNAEPE